ncbi:MAG: metallophosphoesterase [Planctomycetia bacterium]|nr:metallophosphoesterase [Planctomycetia bacterium]
MNRRTFLGETLVALGATSLSRTVWALAEKEVPRDENLVAVFADTHLHDPRTTQQVQRFQAAISQLLAMQPRPANLLIYGDVAYDRGGLEEYRLFRELIQPLEKAGIRWEVAMGNHDRLEDYRQIFPERFEKPSVLEKKLITKVETPLADFLLLDSYKEGCVEGMIDPAQREWLRETLKNYPKRLFVGCHHPLRETDLADILLECPNFVAYLYGHHHYWRNTVEEQVQTVCFPSVGHWGDLGFVTLRLSETEVRFTPHIDDYLYSKWGSQKPVADENVYLRRLNRTLLTLKWK